MCTFCTTSEHFLHRLLQFPHYQQQHHCGLIHSHIVRIESGRYGFSIDTLDKLTTALGVELRLQKMDL